MGKIKKILDSDLVGGSQKTDVYPVTAFKAIYNEQNERLDDVLNRSLPVNVTTEYGTDHIVEPMTLAQAIAKVPSANRTVGMKITFLDTDNNWKQYIFAGDSVSSWNTVANWISSEKSLDEYKESTSETISPMLSLLSNRVDLSGTISQGFYEPDGGFTAGASYKSIEATLDSGKTYNILVTGSVLGVSAIFAQYFNGDAVIGSEKPSNATNGYLLSIPKGTTKVRISSNSTAKFEVLTVDPSIDLQLMSSSINQVIEGLPTNPIELDYDWRNVFFNIAISDKNSAITSGSYSALQINVQEGDTFKYTAKVGGASMAAITFYGDDDQLVGYDGVGGSSNSLYKDRTIVVPKGATQLIYTTNPAYEGIYISQMTYDIDSVITPIRTELDETSETIQANQEVISNIAEQSSKNLYDGTVLNGYVHSAGGFISTSAESTYRATGYIPVKPNTYYYLSGRKELSISNIRCVDENKQNPTKVKQGSTGEENPNSWYTPGGANSQILTSETAAFIQFNLQFTTVHSDFDKVMVELVGDVYNPSFVPSAYQPYELEYKILKKALPDDIGGSSSANHHVVNLKNVPVIMLTGASHGEGYGSVKDKSFVSYLSAMLDWTVENYSLSGSDNIEHFNRIVKGQPISNVHPSNLAGGYSLIILGGNESSYYRNGVDAKYFKDNIIRLCSAIKSYGFEPVLCSYYGDMNRPWSVVVQNVADEYGYMFIDLNANGSRFYSPIYRPWWYNAHYATRTNVIQWFNILKILDNFEKPYSAVKIFRNRNTTPTDINDLLFDNRYEKMKLWRELTLHHIPLKAGYEKYVDRLDLTVYTDTGGGTVNIGATEGVESEYNSFRLGSPITIQDKALIQFTLPSVAPDIENLVLNLDTEDEVDVYVRQYVSPDLEVSLADVGGSFHLTTENPTINIGDVYADSNNAGISFTVVDYDASSKSLITVPSGSFTSEGNMTGTLTRTSGTGTQILNYDKLLDVPGESYFEKALSPKGKWVQIQKSEDSYPITGPTTCMDYDRLDFLVKATSGGSFTIKDVSMEFDSTREKNRRRGKDQRCLALTPETGNQLFTKTTFENAVEDWGAPSSATIWDGQVQYMDGNNVQQTGNHIPTYFKTKKNVSKILRLNKGESVHQDVNMIGESYQCHKYKLKIVARYYPEEALDVNSLPADVRTSQTFDFAKIAVSYKFDNGGSPFTKELYVPLNFAELEQDIIFDSSTGLSTNTITITALDDRVELLLCELYD